MPLYAPQTVSSSLRAPGGECWGKVPQDLKTGESMEGFGFKEDFLWEVEANNDLDGWSFNAYTNGTIAQSGDEGGELNLVVHTSSQTNTGSQVQGAAVFEANADTRIAFGARIKSVDGDKVNAIVGLVVEENDVPANIVSSVADSICFISMGDGNIKAQVNTTAGGHTAVDTGSDLGDATYVWLECFVDGTDVKFYVDGDLKLSWTSSTVTVPVDTPLKFTLANEATEDANNTLTCDIVYCFQWRK